ncbi:MFS transporter [Rhodoligotrophos ferricapiens]|uniref:MFS transporter n=1 Tax=Rhodoligotrophos ferricapiens TaxID=3069264 RepID=UPI00315DD5B0
MSNDPVTSLPVALASAVAIQALASAAALALTTVAPMASADLGVDAHAIGYQVSLIYLLATIVSMFGGGVVRKFGPARVSQMALLAGALGLAGLASGSVIVAVFASMLIGMGYALTNPAASDLLDKLAPPGKRNLIFSLKQTAVPLGGILVALVLPSMAVTFGWRWGLLTFAAAGLVSVLLLQAVRARWDRQRDPAYRLHGTMLEGMRAVWGRPPLRALATMGFLFSAMQLSLASFAVVMLVEEFGWRPIQAGAAAAAVQMSGAVGRVFWGWVADRTGWGLGLLGAIGCMTSVSAMLMPLLPGFAPWLIITVLCLFSAASIGWNGVMLAEAARLSPPGQVGPVAGGVLGLTFLGVVVGPSLFASIYQLYGSYADTYAVLGFLPLLGSLLVWSGRRAERAEMAHVTSE